MTQSLPNLDELVKSMSGFPCTNNWDIVCSYTIDQLNQFLQTQYDAAKLAKEVKVSTEKQDPITGDDFTISYNIQFASPKVSFISGVSGSVTLEMPINDGSSYSVTSNGTTRPPQTIPGNTYSVQAVVPLAAINGDTGEITEQGNIIEFSNGKVHDNHVIIHFNNEKGATFAIDPKPDSKDTDILVTYFLPALVTYFQTEINEVDYALSTVNNTPPASGLSSFTPKSFVFASMGDESEKETGVLSIYIQTCESGNPPGSAIPSFQPGDTSTFPIPSSYTASIILSYDLITKAFLQPQLEASGFTVAFNTVTDGISVQLMKHDSVIAQGSSSDGKFVYGGYSYDGLTLSLEAHPLKLVIKQGQLLFDWEGNATSGWSTYTPEEPGHSTSEYGTIDITIQLKEKTAKLSLSNDAITIIEVDFSSPDFSITNVAEACSGLARLNGCRELIPPFYTQEMKLTIPSINVALNGFDFFITTNLLAPGQHIIDVNSTVGILTPHDFLIVGQIAKK